MSKRMLIDATHAEETRVVVLDGNRLEDFDIETSTKRQLKGNIYLAKVIRVEPSLQAAFVEYGGNRHGFLAFSEIHPDYYQIPVADRQRLLALQAEEARLEEEEEDLEVALNQAAGNGGNPQPPASRPQMEAWAQAGLPPLVSADVEPVDAAVAAAPVPEPSSDAADDDDAPDDGLDMFGSIPEEAPPETIGGDANDADGGDADGGDDQPSRRFPPRFLRNYHIQEVIHRRQILLIQVVKEERGTKGAALTTYLSLAGRFSVLMPNSPRGGGISRKITSATDRRRLKEIMNEVDLPKGMGLIVRTAGAQRPKPEIKRDCEYLLRLWDDIREHTLKSVAPAMIYEEASLIKRAIRDVYSRDIDDITVDGEAGWHAAHEFMRMLMPSHARKVVNWPEQGQSLFARFQVEAQLDAMLQPTVQLRSGGYLVINQAEALVAIDVNSGRSTRERNVEETAVRTNLEAADEVARQLRLRDLAGLIVIDFIDMESKRHNAMVERRLKEALKNDRARIQVGHISHFGLLEMSRQRLRPSLEETTLILCAHCNGTGHVRGTESAALHVLRGVEEEAGRRRSAEVIVHIATPIALYILNHKRERLNEIERRYGMRVIIAADDSLISPRFRVERLRALVPGEELRFVTPDAPRTPMTAVPELDEAEDEEDVDVEDNDDADEEVAESTAEETQESREAEIRGRRRRRRRGPRDDRPQLSDPGAGTGVGTEGNRQSLVAETQPEAVVRPDPRPELVPPDPGPVDDDAARRRSRRGGSRRRNRDEDRELPLQGVPGAEQPDLVRAYAGPTPADPFGGGHAFDIFDAMEQAELNANPVRRAPANRRGAAPQRPHRPPPPWAVADQPPMLLTAPVAPQMRNERADRGAQPEPWALPSRPFMLRRDRYQPRWAQQRGERGRDTTPRGQGRQNNAQTVAPVAKVVEAWAAADEPRLLMHVTEPLPPPIVEQNPAPAPQVPATEVPIAEVPIAEVQAVAITVPIAAGPPPVPEPVSNADVPFIETTHEPPLTQAEVPAAEVPAAEIRVAKADPAQAELPWADAPVPSLVEATVADVAVEVAQPTLVPEPIAVAESMPEVIATQVMEEIPPAANDAAPAPLIQPIVIDGDAAPPVERKRGWWRRR